MHFLYILCFFITDKAFPFSDLASQTEHVNLKTAIVKRTRGTDERVQAAAFIGDIIELRCEQGYEFSTNQVTSVITVTRTGFIGKTKCIRKLFNIVRAVTI